MEYWNNPIETYTNTVLPYGLDTDPIVKSLHGGEHCLFFQPMLPKGAIYYKQKLQDLCDWANNRTVDFTDRQTNFYDIANLVKVNLWIDDIRKQGIVKPMLLTYTGEELYGINNGESRLRCIEVIPEITTVDCFITTHRRYADKFKNLPCIENFDQFAEICRADIGQQFLFRFTDKLAPYGIEWYETNSRKTGSVMPAEELCVSLIKNYLKEHPSVVFSPDWFSTAVDWNLYKTNQ